MCARAHSQDGYEGDGWIEPCNIAMLVFAESGGNKTTSIKFFARHLAKYCEMFEIDITTTSFTVEALVQFIADNAGRATVVMDEANRLVTQNNQYKGGKGDDKEILMEIYVRLRIEHAHS